MNIRDLEYLIALAEFKHFRKAADSCHVSQPTLSGQIRKLEDELGIVLLERTSRKVLFTQAGMLLVEQAARVLKEVKHLRDMASNQSKDMNGPLHMGIIPTLGPYLLPHIIPVMNDKYAEIDLFLYENQTSILLNQLETGLIDCAIIASNKDSQKFIESGLFCEKILLAVNSKHPWSKFKSINPNMLKNIEMFLLDDNHCLRQKSLEICKATGARENTHFQSTSLETIRNLVATNMGVTLIPQLAVFADKSDNIIYLDYDSPMACRQVSLVYRPGSPLRERYEKIAALIKHTLTPVLDCNCANSCNNNK